MLDSQNNTDIHRRDALELTGQMFKYEFISTARNLVPMYSLLPVLALAVGIFFRNTILKVILSSTNKSEVAVSSIFSGTLIWTLCYMFFLIAGIYTISTLSRRFCKSMLGNEAYLNLTLPLTVTEHLIARVFAATVWLLVLSVTAIISIAAFFLSFIDKLIFLINEERLRLPTPAQINDFFCESFGCPAVVFIITAFLFAIAGTMLLVMFIYMVNCIGHLAKKHRKILQFITVIICITIVNISGSMIFRIFAINLIHSLNLSVMILMWISILASLVYAAICGAVCYLILRFRLNLE